MPVVVHEIRGSRGKFVQYTSKVIAGFAVILAATTNWCVVRSERTASIAQKAARRMDRYLPNFNLMNKFLSESANWPTPHKGGLFLVPML
jgi:hypothetical protein